MRSANVSPLTIIMNMYANVLLTELSSPSVINIMKNINDQKVAPGSVAMASGYTTNTSPGPKHKVHTRMLYMI